MKAKRGSALILGGLLLIVAALCLTAYNLWDDKRVENRSETAFATLSALIPQQPPESGQLQDGVQPVWDPAQTPDPMAPSGAPQQGSPQATAQGTDRGTSPQQQHTGTSRGNEQQEGTVPGYSSPERVLPDYELNPEMPMPELPADGYSYIALLRIPALSLELPVMGDWDYERLRSAPCRYVGSIYLDNLVIMAHNYDSHFGRLYRLGWGDELTLTDMRGNVFRYRVTEQEVLDGGDAEPIITGDWDLTLFTCTVGGQSRVTVRCERI